jgi:glycosyltransferase involved in cell wall biosynthesis
VEGLPVAILEAMALGRPVVATAAGGVPGIVKDGETGLLVEPGDAEALAGGMRRLLSDRALAARLAGAALELVEEEYGLEPMVRATEDVYLKVLGG